MTRLNVVSYISHSKDRQSKKKKKQILMIIKKMKSKGKKYIRNILLKPK